MNFTIKLLVSAVLIITSPILSMEQSVHQPFQVTDRKTKVLDTSRGTCIAESCDGAWRVQASMKGELLCRKNPQTNQFEIQRTLHKSRTKGLISIVGAYDKNRFVLRMTRQGYIDVVDALKYADGIQSLARADAELLNRVPVQLVAGLMALDGETITVLDAWRETYVVRNPLVRN
jgi:hypothetical protein